MQSTLQIPAAGSPRIAPLFFNFKVASPDTGTDVCPVNLAPAARLDPKASRSKGSKARAVGWIASNLPVQKYQLYIQMSVPMSTWYPNSQYWDPQHIFYLAPI